jgi:hypothetical protein
MSTTVPAVPSGIRVSEVSVRYAQDACPFCGSPLADALVTGHKKLPRGTPSMTTLETGFMLLCNLLGAATWGTIVWVLVHHHR